MAVVIGLAYCCCLRPGEAMKITTDCVVLPSVLLLDIPLAYIRLGATKTAHIVARFEHATLDDPLLIELLEALIPRLPRRRRFFTGSPTDFRRRHDALVAYFGIQTIDGLGLTPASHRGGGATRLFQATGDLALVQWRARWRTLRAMEIYIQEVASLSVLPDLSLEQRERIRRFASAAPSILTSAAAWLRSLDPAPFAQWWQGAHVTSP